MMKLELSYYLTHDTMVENYYHVENLDMLFDC